MVPELPGSRANAANRCLPAYELIRQGERENGIAGGNRKKLFATERVRNRRGIDPSAGLEFPEKFAAARIHSDDITLAVSGEYDSSGRGQHAAGWGGDHW